jgi:hypothetical protein
LHLFLRGIRSRTRLCLQERTRRMKRDRFGPWLNVIWNFFFPFLGKIPGQNLFKNIPRPVHSTSFPALQLKNLTTIWRYIIWETEVTSFSNYKESENHCCLDRDYRHAAVAWLAEKEPQYALERLLGNRSLKERNPYRCTSATPFHCLSCRSCDDPCFCLNSSPINDVWCIQE